MQKVHVPVALILLLGGLACFCFAAAQESKAPALKPLDSLRARAEQGEVAAQWGLGVIYAAGQGVPQDHAEAARWFRRAAERGDARSQVSLARLYSNGQGVGQDYAEAVRWYRKAAEQGDAAAQSNLGDIYERGQGVTQDYVEAHMWFNLAASRASGDLHKAYAVARDGLGKKMTAQQIAEAQRRARGWKPKSGANAGAGAPK